MKKFIIALIMLFAGLHVAVASESVCNAPLYDPGVEGLFKVTVIPTSATLENPKEVLVMTITNNFPVPMEIGRLAFSAGYEGRVEINRNDWKLRVSTNYAGAYKQSVDDLLVDQVPSTDIIDVGSIWKVSFGNAEKPYVIPSNTSRHFVLQASTPEPHPSSPEVVLRALVDHILLRPQFPTECSTRKSQFAEYELFMPKGVPRYENLRAVE